MTTDEKLDIILNKLDSIQKDIQKIKDAVKYESSHAWRDYLLNVAGDVTGDLVMKQLLVK